jgi:hypothetical protein
MPLFRVIFSALQAKYLEKNKKQKYKDNPETWRRSKIFVDKAKYL